MTEMVFGSLEDPTPYEPKIVKWWRTLDRTILTACLALFSIGLLLGFAASAPLAAKHGKGAFYYVLKQLSFGAIAFLLMIGVSMLRRETIRRFAVFGTFVGIILLIALPYIGTDYGKGAIRWIDLGPLTVQPSEFLKPAFIVTLAWLMAASTSISGPPGQTIGFFMLAAVCFLLHSQPDYGQTFIILAAWITMFFVSGANWLVLGVLFALFSTLGAIAYRVSSHVAERIDGFLVPTIDPTTQLGFATNAIQEGGILGVGIGAGTVKWSLPDAHTDFIIAVAAEEFGFFIVAIIIGLFAFIVVRSLFRLMDERDVFTHLAGTGLIAMFGLQAFINIGVSARLVPTKGMTLPFISYGGSSLLASGIVIGCVLAFTRSRPQGVMSDGIGITGPKDE